MKFLRIVKGFTIYNTIQLKIYINNEIHIH